MISEPMGNVKVSTPKDLASVLRSCPAGELTYHDVLYDTPMGEAGKATRAAAGRPVCATYGGEEPPREKPCARSDSEPGRCLLPYLGEFDSRNTIKPFERAARGDHLTTGEIRPIQKFNERLENEILLVRNCLPVFEVRREVDDSDPWISCVGESAQRQQREMVSEEKVKALSSSELCLPAGIAHPETNRSFTDSNRNCLAEP